MTVISSEERNYTNHYLFKGQYLTEEEYQAALLLELQKLGTHPATNISGIYDWKSDVEPEQAVSLTKFDEVKYINELTNYIIGTYEEHYSKGNVQTFELLVSAGQADGFTMGSIMKYASRYGKKEGYNRKDLLKILHYALLQLYVHDREGRPGNMVPNKVVTVGVTNGTT